MSHLETEMFKIDNLRISHNASGMEANIWVLVTYSSK